MFTVGLFVSGERICYVAAMKQHIAWVLCTVAASAHAEEPIYFAQDWCPSRSEVLQLESGFELTRNGCCIYSARRKSSGAGGLQLPQGVAQRVVREQDLSRCSGENEETRETAAANALEEKRAAAAALQEERKEVARLIPELRTWKLDRLCFVWGELLRNEPTRAAPASAAPALEAELRRQGFKLWPAAARDRQLEVGMDACHVWAAWGYPDRINRTKTARGASDQWVYGVSRYVYTNGNGIVTAVQY